MRRLAIIPKRYLTFARCLEALIKAPNRQLFQSELKRIVYSKSWRLVVKRELKLWNRLLIAEFPPLQLVEFIPAKNPNTGRRNELLIRIPPQIEIIDREGYFVIALNGGIQHEKENNGK